jgi:hypothetical protein
MAQRDSWTDAALDTFAERTHARIDGLNERVGTVENRTDALADMPAVVRDKIDEGMREARVDASRHRAAVRGDIAELRRWAEGRFDRIDEDHARQPRPLGVFGTAKAIFLALIPFAGLAAALIAAFK